MSRYLLTIVPSSLRTRLLLTCGPDEILRGDLPPASPAIHQQAARRLLEGLALWLDQQLPVALSADAQESAFALGLCDPLGIGVHTLFYAVEFVDRRRRGRRIRGIGNFAELRQLDALARQA
jgi:hypothetical protein